MSKEQWWRAAVAVVVAGSLAPNVACSGTPARGAGLAAQAPQGRLPAPEVAYDHALTDTARVLAGLVPEDTTRFAHVLTRPAWATYRTEFDSHWSRVSEQRFRAMRGWREREFKASADACDTLFYPFGGPDVLNAYELYPGCSRYLLLGLEPTGSVPAIERLPGERIDAVLARMRESLADIFLRDYFITRTMMTELQTPEVDGTIPLMLAFLARLDAHVISLTLDGPWNTAPVPPAGDAPGGRGRAALPAPGHVPGVTITFVAAGSTHVQTLSYVRVNLQNDQVARRTSLLAYLNGLAPFTTFVKSASYLMHDDRFSRVRGIVLHDSTSILQDDTGVPYRFFDEATWDLTLYGKYTAPVQDFKYGFQKDLNEAFARPSAARPLPFTFGYHWRMGSSSVMLAIRKPAMH